MAKIYLACEALTHDHPFARRDFERMQALCSSNRVKKHELAESPDGADLVAFIGSSSPNFSDIKSSVLYRKFKHKSVVFYSGDSAIPVMPGVYTCLEKRWFALRRKGVRSGFYLRVAENASMDIPERIEDARYLFSFVGSSANHPVRRAVLRLSSPRALIRDTAGEARQADGVAGENRERGMLYRDVIAQSKFVLCPAGRGISSWRLFETMRAGRVPVIIADRWVPGDGPLWETFAVFVAEREVAGIPELLARREPEVGAMGSAARQAWELFYSEQTAFSTLVDLLVDAHKDWQAASWLSKVPHLLQYLEPFYFRHWVLSPLKRILLRR